MTNQFGYFDVDANEYVVARPDTPLSWMNYLGADSFYGICSNTGGGYTFYKDARMRRLTRYRYNDSPMDNMGRYLYVKEGEILWKPDQPKSRFSWDRSARSTLQNKEKEITAKWIKSGGSIVKVYRLKVEPFVL